MGERDDNQEIIDERQGTRERKEKKQARQVKEASKGER